MGADDRLTGERAIRRRLVEWYVRHQRDLPWRRTRDPYRIWVSEIMLQQTRAQAVIPYYERFLARFPDAASLAAAAEPEVLALWSGLGYYSRARNLQRAAREIVAAGRFPRDYDAVRALAGVGDYTAAAVSSIAFDLPHAVLDGNVMRVLARLTNDAADIAATSTRRRLRDRAQALLDRRQPGVFNQALMELGATVCLPKVPQCQVCPLAAQCRARIAGTARQLPVKLRRKEPVTIAETLVIARRGGRLLLWQRDAASSRMAGFWELPAPAQLPGLREGAVLGTFRHTITHHHYTFTVISGRAPKVPGGFRWFRPGELGGLPLSTAARKALALTEVIIN